MTRRVATRRHAGRPTQAQARAILARRLETYSGTQEDFAWVVLLTHERTLTRWLTGVSPIPAPVLDWCARHRGA